MIIFFILLNIIPGASSGIGEGTAVHLAKLGSRLSLAGRSVDNLKRVAGLCQEQGVSEQNVSGFHNGLRDRQSHKRNTSFTATDIITSNKIYIQYARGLLQELYHGGVRAEH